MAIVVRSQYESQVLAGKVFDYNVSDPDVDDNVNVDIIICTNDNKIELESVQIEGNVETSNWQAFVAPVYTGGTVVQPIPKNQIKARAISAEVILNPTITNVGIPFFTNPIELVAEQRGANAYMNERIINNYLLPNGNCYLIRLTNTSGVNKRIDTNITVILK